jgi:hypothetical protein
MSDETPIVAPICEGPVQVVMPPAVEAQLPPETTTLPRPDQVRAAEAVFSQEDESSAVMGVIGLWTGTLLLHDLALEHFDRPADEKEPVQARRARPEEEQP